MFLSHWFAAATQATASKYNDNSHYNNGQVMTQISAIYAKRSRSILNQFG